MSASQLCKPVQGCMPVSRQLQGRGKMYSVLFYFIPFHQLTLHTSFDFQISQVHSNSITCCPASILHRMWRHQLSHTAHTHARDRHTIALLQHCRRASLRRGMCGVVATRGSVCGTSAYNASHAMVIQQAGAQPVTLLFHWWS